MTNDKLKQAAELYKQLIIEAGEDPFREGLKDTPQRAAKAFMTFTDGYRQNLQEIINGALFHTDVKSIVMVTNVELYSLCEHHLLPFIGRCHIGYIPNGKVLGLSKFARLVDYFARRLQIQENLTHDIAQAIQNITDAEGVGVVIEAKHLCMMMRGVQKQNSVMVTSTMLGSFLTHLETRKEFLDLLKLEK